MLSNNTKNYVDIYTKNLLLGAQVGEASYIVAPFSKEIPLHTHPLSNRITDLGIYNLIQDQLYAPIKANTSNIIYLGMLQAAKYLPNILVQTLIKEKLYCNEDNIGMKSTKTFIITSSGMTLFFTIGAIENIITDLTYKTSFVYSIALGSIGYYGLSGMESTLTKAGAINLSLMGAVSTTVGLIGSFLTPYALHELGIDKINPIKILEYSTMISMLILNKDHFFIAAASILMIDIIFDNESVKNFELEKIGFLGFNLANILSLAMVTGANLATSNYDDAIIAMSKISAFSFAKANAVTGIEVASDYKKYICSYPVIESVCELLGITEVTEISIES